jgi:3-hydroxyisobutyrate dehydrogenase-like beta-hydroxyacid dehydrogenase
MSNRKIVGFIGLGTMGSHMARNLLKAGHAVHAYDLRADAAHAIEGVAPAATAADGARQANIVITMRHA